MRGLNLEFQFHPSYPLEDPLSHHALTGQEVADYPEREKLHRDDEQDCAKQQGLDVAVAVPVEYPVGKERHPGGDRKHERDDPEGEEDLERFVARIDAQDCQSVSANVG